jgi:hypothetical protein
MMTIAFDCRGLREIQRGKLDDLRSTDRAFIESAAMQVVSSNKRDA